MNTIQQCQPVPGFLFMQCCYRIIKGGKTAKVIQSNHQPITIMPADPCHLMWYPPFLFEHLQGWWLHYSLGSLYQCLATLLEKLCLISNLNLPWPNSWLFLLVLSLLSGSRVQPPPCHNILSRSCKAINSPKPPLVHTALFYTLPCSTTMFWELLSLLAGRNPWLEDGGATGQWVARPQRDRQGVVSTAQPVLGKSDWVFVCNFWSGLGPTSLIPMRSPPVSTKQPPPLCLNVFLILCNCQKITLFLEAFTATITYTFIPLSAILVTLSPAPAKRKRRLGIYSHRSSKITLGGIVIWPGWVQSLIQAVKENW